VVGFTIGLRGKVPGKNLLKEKVGNNNNNNNNNNEARQITHQTFNKLRIQRHNTVLIDSETMTLPRRRNEGWWYLKTKWQIIEREKGGK
jgi:hypothetical protein